MLVAIASFLFHRNNIFFSQKRLGVNQRQFSLFKFRSMIVNAQSQGSGLYSFADDHRITPFGKFIRRTSLDELPQLINVFLGDMSVIGPRPQDQRCFDAFPVKAQPIIASVLPGLSGIGSVVFRDEEEMIGDASNADFFYDNVIMPFKAELEIWFVENFSVYVYFKLISLTILAIFAPRASNPWSWFKDLPQPPQQLKRYLSV